MIEIYGSSDDLIELEGDISEEFNHYSDEKDRMAFLAFSDGTILSVLYDSEGIWRINRRHEGSAKYSKVEATDPDTGYSDRVTLEGEINGVVFGVAYAKKIRS